MSYYKLDKILKKNAQYNMVIGKRSNGKTYASLEYGIKEYFKNKKEIAYIRRWNDDIKAMRCRTMFEGLEENGIIEKYSGGVYTNVIYKGGAWYMCRYEEDDKGNKECIKEEKPFCYGFSLNNMEHDKSTSYPRIKTLIFDEFITRGMYLNDEFIVFMNVVSTIARNNTDVKIFMLANTVNKYCPYFSEMGLKNIKQQEPNSIDVYRYGTSDLKVAVEYVAPEEGTGKGGNILFAFNNPKLQMITRGTWEIDVYPHLPIKYKSDDVIFQYFIKWDGDILHCEIVKKDNNFFTYIHQKTSDIQNENKDIIFSQESDPRPNFYTRLTKPCDRLTEKISSFYKRDKVFFQNNEVGEIMFNYLKWCGK